MSAFEHDDVTILTSADGERVALHHYGGPAGGPPLLLSHGNGLNAGMWAATLPELTGRFRCHGLDLRGHGRSRPVDPHYRVTRTAFAADVMAAVEAIGGPVAFAGHSLGAASAVVAARDHASLHQLFTGLWLFEPVLIPRSRRRRANEPSFLAEMARKRRMEFDSIDDAVTRFCSKPPFASCHPRAVRGYVETGTTPTADGVRLSCRGEDEARVFEAIEDLDFADLAAIDVPALVVSGAAVNEANALPPQLAPVVADALGRGRWIEFPGLSHFGPMEAPVEMARSIIDFFSDQTG